MSQPSRFASKPAEGSIVSYVVGFMLALILTVIPYYLVVHQIVTGNVLLGTILVFALAQMLVQITFFLHIGSGPKPNWNLFFFGSTVAIIMVVVGGSIVIISNLNYNMTAPQQSAKAIADEGIAQVGGIQTGACPESFSNHIVIIKNGTANPLHSAGGKCDTLTFVNQDSQKREITFGAYPVDTAYAGQKDLVITKGFNQTIPLSVVGTYQFYDRLQPKTAGNFTVVP